MRRLFFVFVIISMVSLVMFQTLAIRPLVESFISAYNSTQHTDTDTSSSVFSEETNQLQALLTKAGYAPIQDTVDGVYQKIPDIVQFAWRRQLGEFALKALQKVLSSQDVKMTKMPHNVKWKDVLNTRHIMFEANISDPNKAFTRKFRIHVSIKNLDSYLSDDGNYVPGVTLELADVAMLGMELADTMHVQPVAAPAQQPVLNDNHFYSQYRIQNDLHLLDPFLTSGSDMKVTESMKQAFLAELKSKDVPIQQYRGFCFGLENQSASSQEQCTLLGGTWDFPPTSDSDCPFYKANANYPNNFGRLTSDVCEMPMDMQVIGHRYFSAEKEPLCYNCKENLVDRGTLGYCCDVQKDRQKYPALTTPDFAFSGDEALRRKYNDMFIMKGMSSW